MIKYIILLEQEKNFDGGTKNLNIWDFICCHEESTDMKIFDDFTDALDYRRKHNIIGSIVELPINKI